MNSTTSKWKDKEFKRQYNKQYRERIKLHPAVNAPTKSEGTSELSGWKKRQLQKQSSQVRPLELPGCPSCGGEFLRRINGKIEPMRLSSCSVCNMRFYYAGGLIK